MSDDKEKFVKGFKNKQMTENMNPSHMAKTKTVLGHTEDGKKVYDSEAHKKKHEETAEHINQYKKDKLKKKAKDYAKKAYGNIPCGEGLAGKICRVNNKKLNKKTNTKKTMGASIMDSMNKSFDFQDSVTSIDMKDHYVAERTVSPELLAYLKTASGGDITRLPFEKGLLVINKIEKGLYSATFQDKTGDIIERFHDKTLEMIGKTMEVKELYTRKSVPKVSNSDDKSATLDQADTIAEAHIDHHNVTMHGPNSGNGNYIKIKYGDFELEVKKSIHDFVNDFKKAQTSDKGIIRKAVKAWRRNNSAINFRNDSEAAEALIENWSEDKESFFQTLHALQQLNNRK